MRLRLVTLKPGDEATVCVCVCVWVGASIVREREKLGIHGMLEKCLT